jgi:DNA (cytosine-5)-methyltransferase 1
MYGAIAPPFVALETYRWNTATLKAGKTVELADGTFLQIEAVIQNLATDEVTLRGLIFKRCTAFEGEFKRDVNEVAAVFVVQLDDPRSEKEQNLMQVRLEQVVKLRKLVVTNYPSPVHRYNKDDVPPATTDEKMKYIRDNESLATRWKHVTYFENAQQRKANRTSRNNFHFRKIVSVTRDECSLDMHLDPDTLKYAWRGETTIGGAGGRQDNVPRDLGHSVDDDDMLIDEIRSSPPTLRPDGRKYTFIDVFCGCGGATCGANLAGFHIKLGVDIDRSAGESWQRNNPDAKFYHMSAQDFCRLGDLDGGLIADVVHLSFPCQFFSPAHTRAGPNDVANAIVVTVLEKILKLTKPRIVTLEETDGLLRRHRDYFNGMVETFTKLGFSISWQMVNMVNFGVPQSRKRLIMVAAWYFPPF